MERPGLKKPFRLYVHETQSISLLALIQTLGNIPPPVAYFAEKLEQAVKGWPFKLEQLLVTDFRKLRSVPWAKPPLCFSLTMSVLFLKKILIFN